MYLHDCPTDSSFEDPSWEDPVAHADLTTLLKVRKTVTDLLEKGRVDKYAFYYSLFGPLIFRYRHIRSSMEASVHLSLSDRAEGMSVNQLLTDQGRKF
jgi:hypothetical protein